MRAVVAARWLEFTEPLEGGCSCLYNDVRGLTTIAYGNLVNAPSQVVSLPFVHPDGRPATFAEITAAWHTVHADPLCAKRGWTYAAKLTPLRLTLEGMKALALGKLAQNDAALHKRLPDWETYPACAQLALHSLAWACGAGAHFPRLFSAAATRDWDACSVEIHMNEWTPEGIRNAGLVPRNVANKILMANASMVDRYHLDPDLLDWKRRLGVADVEMHPDPPSEPTPTPGRSYAHDLEQLGNLKDNAASSPTIAPEPDTLGSMCIKSGDEG